MAVIRLITEAAKEIIPDIRGEKMAKTIPARLIIVQKRAVIHTRFAQITSEGLLLPRSSAVAMQTKYTIERLKIEMNILSIRFRSGKLINAARRLDKM